MVEKVIQFAAKRQATAAPLIESVIARSKINRTNSEDAWVSMVTASGDHVLVVKFAADEYGEEAWARAVKYAKRFSERLGVSIRKKRGLAENLA